MKHGKCHFPNGHIISLSLGPNLLAVLGLVGRITSHAPPLPLDFGTHHSKFMILEYGPSQHSVAGGIRGYEGGVRVVVHTANYIFADCNSKTQGLWWQDFPPRARASASSGAGSAPSPAAQPSSRETRGAPQPGRDFGADLERYLSRLKLPQAAHERYLLA